MIDGSEKRNRQLAFELQNSHVCEKRSKKKVAPLCFYARIFKFSNFRYNELTYFPWRR